LIVAKCKVGLRSSSPTFQEEFSTGVLTAK
jgi:hypothetical protein